MVLLAGSKKVNNGHVASAIKWSVISFAFCMHNGDSLQCNCRYISRIITPTTRVCVTQNINQRLYRMTGVLTRIMFRPEHNTEYRII